MLLDLHLPDIGGDEVALELRADETTAAIPIIVLSADAYASQRRRLLRIGVDEYVTKPFKIAEMIETVERFVKRRPSGRTSTAPGGEPRTEARPHARRSPAHTWDGE